MKKIYFISLVFLVILIGCKPIVNLIGSSKNGLKQMYDRTLEENNYAMEASKRETVVNNVLNPNDDNVALVSKNDKVKNVVISDTNNINTVINSETNMSRVKTKGKQLNENELIENWPEKLPNSIKANTFESSLQSFFKNYTIDICKCISITNQEKRCYIPRNLRKFLPTNYITKECYNINDVGAYALFLYILDEDDIKNIGQLIINPDRFIEIENVDLSCLPLKKEYLNHFFYKNNCSSLFQSSLDAGIEIPYVNLKAGMNADVEGTTQTICLGGYFHSSLTKYLEGDNAQKTFIYFHIWKKYADRQNQNKKLYCIKNFAGVSLVSNVNSQSSFNFNINAGVKFQDYINADLKFQYSKKEVFSGDNWITLIDKKYYDEKKNEIIEELLQPKQIASFINENIKRINQNDYNNPFYENTINTHEVIFLGIPEFAMNGNDWSIIYEGEDIYQAKPNITLSYVDLSSGLKEKNDPAYKACKFTISGIPNQNFFKSNISSISKNYKIRYNKKIDDQYIELNIENQIFPVYKYPDINVYLDEYASVTEQNNTFSWKGKAHVTNPAKNINYELSFIQPQVINFEVKNSNISNCRCTLRNEGNDILSVEIQCNYTGEIDKKSIQNIKTTFMLPLKLKSQLNIERRCEFSLPVYNLK